MLQDNEGNPIHMREFVTELSLRDTLGAKLYRNMGKFERLSKKEANVDLKHQQRKEFSTNEIDEGE